MSELHYYHRLGIFQNKISACKLCGGETVCLRVGQPHTATGGWQMVAHVLLNFYSNALTVSNHAHATAWLKGVPFQTCEYCL